MKKKECSAHVYGIKQVRNKIFFSLKFDHFKGGKGKKVSESSSFEQDSLTWNAVASADLFKQALYEQAEASGRIGWNIRLENFCL